MKIEIMFRQTRPPMPRDWRPGAHWVVEAYPTDREPAHPIGLAWVTVGPQFGFVDGILVWDGERRNGVATRLLDAIRQRWANVGFDGVTGEGAAFVKAYRANRIVQGGV